MPTDDSFLHEVSSSASATAGFQGQTRGRAAPSLVAGLRLLESEERIDAVARPLEALADAALRSPPVADALRGTWLGHALHPLLTDFPLGAWMSGSLLDLFGGAEARRPAQRLIGFGLLTALPTVASGLAEWRDTEGGARRVGVFHALVNSTALALYGTSYLARRTGRQRLAVGLGVGGGVVATLGGYLGGHLSLVRKIGTADPGFGPDRP